MERFLLFFSYRTARYFNTYHTDHFSLYHLVVHAGEGHRNKRQSGIRKEYETFITSIKKREHSPKSDNADHFSQKHKIVLASFDPNTADSSTFLSLGLPSWMAGNILRYRAKGGNFRKPEDLRKIYGLTEKQYKTLLPYISISTAEKHRVKDTIRLLTHKKHRILCNITNTRQEP